MKLLSNIMNYTGFIKESAFLEDPATGPTMTLEEAISMSPNDDFTRFLKSPIATELTTRPYVMQSTGKQVKNGTFCFGRIGSHVRFIITEEGYVRAANYASNNYQKIQIVFGKGDVFRYFFTNIRSDGDDPNSSLYERNRYAYAARMLRMKLDLDAGKQSINDYPKFNRLKFNKPQFMFMDSSGEVIYETPVKKVDLGSAKGYLDNRIMVKVERSRQEQKKLDNVVIKDPIILQDVTFSMCSMKGAQFSDCIGFSVGFYSCDMQGSSINISVPYAFLDVNGCNLTNSSIVSNKELDDKGNNWPTTFKLNQCDMSGSNLTLSRTDKLHIIGSTVRGMKIDVEQAIKSFKAVYNIILNKFQFTLRFDSQPLIIERVNISESKDLIQLIARNMELLAGLGGFGKNSLNNLNAYDSVFVKDCDFSGVSEQEMLMILSPVAKYKNYIEDFVMLNRNVNVPKSLGNP